MDQPDTEVNENNVADHLDLQPSLQKDASPEELAEWENKANKLMSSLNNIFAPDRIGDRTNFTITRRELERSQFSGFPSNIKEEILNSIQANRGHIEKFMSQLMDEVETIPYDIDILNDYREDLEFLSSLGINTTEVKKTVEDKIFSEEFTSINGKLGDLLKKQVEKNVDPKVSDFDLFIDKFNKLERWGFGDRQEVKELKINASAHALPVIKEHIDYLIKVKRENNYRSTDDAIAEDIKKDIDRLRKFGLTETADQYQAEFDALFNPQNNNNIR